MRKAICFVIASALLVGGLYWFGTLWAAPGPVKKIMFIASAVTAAAGAVWLWGDYIAPLLGLRSAEEE